MQAANAVAAKALQARLERALMRLPIADPCRPDAIPYSAFTPGIARQLTLMATRERDRAAAREARKELLRAAAAASALAEQLGKLPFAATAAVGGMTSAILQAELNSFAAKATRARRLFSTPRGEQAKVSALRITEYLYQEFFRLTGKEGKRSVCWEDGREVGAFNGLLKEVFAALDVDASADAMARKVVDAHRGQHGDD